jgi:hypothetical protein
MIRNALAFGNRGTYNPANRKKGVRLQIVQVVLCSPGPARHSKAGIRTQSGPGGMQLLLRLLEYVS